MEGPISRNRASRIRDRVEGLLAEDHPECLSDLRDFKRRHPDFRSGRKQTKTQAGIDASVEDLIPVLHLRRARRGAPAPLETLRYRCWEIGFQTGIEVDARHDFECVLHRWARQRTEEQDLDEDLPEPEELAKAVVRRLRPSRFWKLALGFVPIVGPVAAYRIDGALALRFHDLAAEYFHELRSSGIRPLPDDFAIPPPPRPHRGTRKDRSTVSTRREVERYLSEHRSEERMRQVRRMARLGDSLRMARMMAGSYGFAVISVPVRHLWFSRVETGIFLSMLQGICWQAGVKAAREDEHVDDFERVLLRWAGRDRDDEAPTPEELVAAVSAKLRAAHLWKLAFGFLPVIGPLLAFIINGSMAARFYRLAHRFYEQREPLVQIAR
jgi:hypothetical protein